MTSKKIIENLWDLFMPIVVQAGLELYDIEFLKEGPNWYLRIYIDKDEGITIDDCEKISRKVEPLLDEKDLIAQSYILEVSSPGLDRELKKDSDYEKYKGKPVDIKLYKAKNKQKKFQGTLISLQEGVVSIHDEKDGMLTFEKGEIASCRLSVFF